MKMKIFGFIIGFFLIVGLTQSGYAANWYVNWDGIAGGDTTQTDGHFDIDSPNAVVFDSGITGVGDFTNYGLVTIIDDGTNTLTGEYVLTGTQTGSDLGFNPGGTLTLSVNGTERATLSLVEGVGFYSDVIENGFVSLIYNLDSITDGYLFWAAGDSSWVVDETTLISTTNMIPNNNLLEIDELIDTFAQVDDSALFLASGGQVSANPVPVPSALLLLGSGLIGLVGFRRKIS